MVLRQRVWIDRRVQGVLTGRIVVYWLLSIIYLGLGCTCFQYYQHPDWPFEAHAAELFSQFWPWLPSLILLLPLVIFDIVRLSNLFVGPIHRLRMHLAQLNDDPSCRSLSFREDDYWTDLAEPINCLQAEILTLRAEVARLNRCLAAEQLETASTTKPKTRAANKTQRALPAMGAAPDN